MVMFKGLQLKKWPIYFNHFKHLKVLNPFTKLLANHIIYHPTASNINYG